ncbi:ERVV2 protein, partial [Thinocorus orbignyianus]|nr:ERVV2 protein [Thinocorus orbignyianus]
TKFYSLARWFLPWLGVSELEKAIVNISAEMEIIANSTANALYHLNQEIKSLQGVVFQNRMALDIITARMGGVCTVINMSCCTYVDDSSRIEIDLQ